jgi:hypothetical protein
MYGRQPHLPIYFLLGRNDGTSAEINIDRWVGIHAEKLAFAFNRAEEIQRNEADRKKRHDVEGKQRELKVGEKVYIRNRGVKGRDNSG